MASFKYFLAFLTIAGLIVDVNAGQCISDDCGFGGHICDTRLDRCVNKIQLCDQDSDCVSSDPVSYGHGYCHNGKCICYADENCPKTG
ncbi:hypothetical protein DdX_15961 [Ditylenchus destructor]|uniref:Uncharacterized protein n=1 Tax=Ditylenchus destructor TaxID=166010 RepID=A0AAD4MQE6_9BILA|nr:hypothetical protein DdX_15961 [Ditylenchus destructor]